MKQSVNFYRGEAKEPILLFGIEWMIGVLVASSVFFGIVSALQLSDNRQIQANIAAAQQELQAANLRLMQTAATHPIVTKTDPLLVAEAEHKQRTATELRNMLETIKHGDWVNHGGFAGYFEALARQTVAGIWLTGIALEEGGKNVVIEGRTLDAGNIPVLVKALGNEPVFKGKTFSDLTIKQDEEQVGQVIFTLRTVPEKAKNGKP